MVVKVFEDGKCIVDFFGYMGIVYFWYFIVGISFVGLLFCFNGVV